MNSERHRQVKITAAFDCQISVPEAFRRPTSREGLGQQKARPGTFWIPGRVRVQLAPSCLRAPFQFYFFLGSV